MLDDAGQVDGRFDAGVTATYHRHPLALEEGTVAVRAVGHALGAVLELARHVQVAPAGTGRQDHGAALQGGAGGQLHVHIAILADGGGALLGDHFHAVLLDVLLQARGQLGALGVGHGDEVLDADGVHHLTAEALGDDGGADPLAGGIDGGSSASRATAHHQHVIGGLFAQLCGLALGRAGIELGHYLFERCATLAERLAVQVDVRHRHDLALVHLILEQGTVDHGVGDAGVQGGHQVQGLHHVRAVVAGEGDIGLEVELALEVPDLLQHGRIGLGGVAAALQQGEHQGGEFMTHGDAGKMHARCLALWRHAHGRLASGGAIGHGNLGGHLGYLVGQCQELCGFVAVIAGHADLDGIDDVLQVTVELLFEVGI
ncbi:hypothetical protein D3C84_383890 [compost metagenome]